VAYVQKEIRHLVGKALHDYDMIQHGEKILVAVSGGKDSFSLLWLLHERLSRIPITYSLFPVHIDLGFSEDNLDHIESFLKTFPYSYKIEKTDYGIRAHSEENRENPCFLCSWLRRKRLFELAKENKCKKIAFGHHMDDLIETFFINIFYSAQISTMLPYQEFFGGELTVIRPLCMVPEEKLLRLCELERIPILENKCPSAGKGKREKIRKVLQEFYRENKKIRGNIFHAMHNVNLEYLPKKRRKREG